MTSKNLYIVATNNVLGVGWSNSLSDMNPVDIVLGLHVDLDPLIHIAGIPVATDVVVDYIIEVG